MAGGKIMTKQNPGKVLDKGMTEVERRSRGFCGHPNVVMFVDEGHCNTPVEDKRVARQAVPHTFLHKGQTRQRAETMLCYIY